MCLAQESARSRPARAEIDHKDWFPVFHDRALSAHKLLELAVNLHQLLPVSRSCSQALVRGLCKLRVGSCTYGTSHHRGTRCTSSPFRPGSCPQSRVLVRSSVLGFAARPPPSSHATSLARDVYYRTNSPKEQILQFTTNPWHGDLKNKQSTHTYPQLSRAIRSVTNSIL